MAIDLDYMVKLKDLGQVIEREMVRGELTRRHLWLSGRTELTWSENDCIDRQERFNEVNKLY